MQKNNKLIIYKDKSGEIRLDVSVNNESVWLTQAQIASLFGTKRPAITKHLSNIFNTEELSRSAVCSILEHTAGDGKKYKTKFYNLDAIISVGYRVNSQKATQFRIWANKILKQYLLEGYAINEKRLIEAKNKLKELQDTVLFLSKGAKTPDLLGQEQELFSVLEYYTNSISILGKYDEGKLRATKGISPIFELTYESALNIINELKHKLLNTKEASSIFGSEIENKFRAAIGNIYQTFDGVDLYSSVEEKAAHILYFVTKDHAFSDGNKRIASILFVYFLEKNRHLYRTDGERKINDNTLVALAILTASSDPKDKEILIKLITNLIKD